MQQEAEDVDYSEVFSMENVALNMRSVDYWCARCTPTRPSPAPLTPASPTRSRTFVAIVSGCAAGVMGLTGLVGFGFCLLTTFMLSLGMYFSLGGKPAPYFKGNDIWTQGVSGALMVRLDARAARRPPLLLSLPAPPTATQPHPRVQSYILFWTLFYDIVHIY